MMSEHTDYHDISCWQALACILRDRSAADSCSDR